MKNYLGYIKHDLYKKGIIARNVKITSYDIPKYINYCYTENGTRKQGTYIIKEVK